MNNYESGIRSVPEFSGIDSEEPCLVYSNETICIEELLDKHPVDLIRFFSENSIHTYGVAAADVTRPL